VLHPSEGINDFDLALLKPGCFVIGLDTDHIYGQGYGYIITMVKSEGFEVRDECHNNSWFITNEEMKRGYKFPIETSDLTQEEFENFGVGFLSINWCLRNHVT
jgi:hypothetical protein